MKYPSLVIGLTAAALLLVVLGLTRLMVVRTVDADIEIREVDIAVLPEPPPPVPEDQPQEEPPPPSLMNIAAVPDPTRVAVPKASVPLALDAPVDLFSADIAPAPLPAPPPVVRPKPRPTPAVRPRPRPAPPAPPRPVLKSHYTAGELDGQPRLLRAGSTVFPSALSRKGVMRGTVTLEVELSERGSVRVRRVISATHPELVSPAKRVATGSRYSAPRKNGRPVKAIMRWPITIRK